MADNNSEQIIKNITLAKQNDQKGFSFLLNAYWDTVYNFILRKCNNENDAEDLSIETFSRAFDKIASFNSQYPFKGWLLTIAKNLYIDMIRKNKDEVLSEKEMGAEISRLSQQQEENILDEEKWKILVYQIKKLKPHYRKIIQMHYFEEIPYIQIAEILGESLSNIKVKSFRARKLLENLLK